MQKPRPICLYRATQVAADISDRFTDPTYCLCFGRQPSGKTEGIVLQRWCLALGSQSHYRCCSGSRKSQEHTGLLQHRDSTDTPCPCSTLSKCLQARDASCSNHYFTGELFPYPSLLHYILLAVQLSFCEAGDSTTCCSY